MGDKDGFTIIVPAYNESLAIVDTIREIKNMDGNFELIVVDDGSTDGTFENAVKTGAKVLRHGPNKGYGAALKTGIRNANYDIIVITDADGTYPISKIPELVSVFENGKYDMVVGARTQRDAQIPMLRRPAKWFITKLANFLTGAKIPDLNSGLRVMKKSIVEKYIDLLPNGFSFTSTITLAMLTNGYNVKYLAIDYFTRYGKSKIRPLYDTFNFIQLIIRMVLYFNPLRVFLLLSMPLIFGGFFLVIFQAILFRNIGTIAVIILLAGIQLLAIGMLADLIDKRT